MDAEYRNINLTTEQFENIRGYFNTIHTFIIDSLNRSPGCRLALSAMGTLLNDKFPDYLTQCGVRKLSQLISGFQDLIAAEEAGEVMLSLAPVEEEDTERTPQISSSDFYGMVYVPDEVLVDLKQMALPEQWVFGNPALAGDRCPLLKSYLRFTGGRLLSEGKIVFSTDHKYGCFNTGLMDRAGCYIFGIIGPNPSKGPQPCVICGFAVPPQGIWGEYLAQNFCPLPEPARYTDNAADLVYDPWRPKPLIDWKHIIIDHCDRIPFDVLRAVGIALPENASFPLEDLSLLSMIRRSIVEDPRKFQDLRRLLDGAIDETLRLVRRNYRLAVPMYSPLKRTVSIGLPLFFIGQKEPSLVLVVENTACGGGIGRTVFPLEFAYNNARLLASLEGIDWLDPSRIQSFFREGLYHVRPGQAHDKPRQQPPAAEPRRGRGDGPAGERGQETSARPGRAEELFTAPKETLLSAQAEAENEWKGEKAEAGGNGPGGERPGEGGAPAPGDGRKAGPGNECNEAEAGERRPLGGARKTASETGGLFSSLKEALLSAQAEAEKAAAGEPTAGPAAETAAQAGSEPADADNTQAEARSAGADDGTVGAGAGERQGTDEAGPAGAGTSAVAAGAGKRQEKAGAGSDAKMDERRGSDDDRTAAEQDWKAQFEARERGHKWSVARETAGLFFPLKEALLSARAEAEQAVAGEPVSAENDRTTDERPKAAVGNEGGKAANDKGTPDSDRVNAPDDKRTPGSDRVNAHDDKDTPDNDRANAHDDKRQSDNNRVNAPDDKRQSNSDRATAHDDKPQSDSDRATAHDDKRRAGSDRVKARHGKRRAGAGLLASAAAAGSQAGDAGRGGKAAGTENAPARPDKRADDAAPGGKPADGSEPRKIDLMESIRMHLAARKSHLQGMKVRHKGNRWMVKHFTVDEVPDEDDAPLPAGSAENGAAGGEAAAVPENGATGRALTGAGTNRPPTADRHCTVMATDSGHAAGRPSGPS